MTCMHDRDEQCFSDCPNCPRTRELTYCTECGQSIHNGEDCYHLDGEIYCSQCIESVLDSTLCAMPFGEKMEYLGANRMTWEG